MSRRMNSSMCLGIMAWLFCLGSIQADPPQPDAAPLADSKVAEPQRVRTRKATRDVPSKSAELQQLRDEIRELRQDVRELIQRFDREQAAAVAQPPVTPPTKAALNAGKPWGPTPLAHESVIENAWQMLGLRLAPLTELERKQFPSKYQGGMRVTEVRSDSPASQNKIRKDDILVGLHVWETTSFDNLAYVLGHSHIMQLGTLKFYVLRGTETLFGELKIVTPAMPMPSSLRSGPAPHSRSIALSDLPNKLVTEFDKLKLHIEVHRAIVETAAEAHGIKVTDDEVNQYLRHLQVQSKTDQIPFAVFLQGMKLLPLFSQAYEGNRQQLALVKLSGQANEPTDEELQDAYRLAQAGRVGRRRFAFPDNAQALAAARDMRLNPKPLEENAPSGWVTDWHGSVSLIPTVPPQPADEAVAKLQEGELSDVIPEGDQFAIYQRLSVLKPKGTFDDLKPQLRATLILNKTNEISLREIERLRKAYRLIVVPAGVTSAATGPTKLNPAQIPLHNADWESPAQPGHGPAKLDPLAVPAGQATDSPISRGRLGGRSWEDIANRRSKYTPDDDDAKLVLATYSVADLVVPVQPMQLQFRVDDNKAKLVGLDKPVPPANSLAQLLEMITSTIAPDSWEEAGGHGKMTVHDSTLSLVVSQTPAVHDELRSTLKLLRTVSDQRVSLEFRVIKTDENFHGFGFGLPFAWTQLKPNEGKLLNSKDADALIAAAQEERRTSLISLLKLTLMTGQPMTLDVTSGSLPAPLHLSGFAMLLAADGHGFTRLHLSVRGTDEQSAAHNLTTVRDGHSLLINLTNVIQSGTQEGVPILNKVPHADRHFKNVSAPKSLKPGEQLFLLATPRLVAPKAEEESLLGVPD